MKAFIPFLPFFSAYLSSDILFGASKSCKCLYGEACWPSIEVFDALSTQLSQPLLRPHPVASPCYSSSEKDASLCAEAKANWVNMTWRTDAPGGYQNLNFETYIFPNNTVEFCYLDTSRGAPCGQGAIPPVGVDARSPKDVQAAVRFAKEHNLKIVVKNTGHDLLGRSSGRGGFMIWTHNMKSIESHDDFAPEGAPESEKGQTAVTFGAGVQWKEGFEAVNKKNRLIVGGNSQDGSVGAAGGWLFGGGHGAFSGKFGLGVDNVLQMTLVNADGDRIVVNEYQNPDLWWALRGGGGGTWGVVTSVTYRTYPIVPFTGVQVTVNFASDEGALRGMTEYVRAHAVLSDNEWGGYAFFTPSMLSFFYIAPNVSLQDATETVSPLLKALRDVGEENPLMKVEEFKSIEALDYFFLAPATPIESTAGLRIEVSSRFLDRETARDKAEETARTLLSLGGAGINYVGGGAVNRPKADATSLHPGWRNALAEVYIMTMWTENDSVEAIRAAQDDLRKRTLVLDRISSDSAAYLNEATFYEEDFKKSFWGPNYPRLRKIKDSVDPTGLFVVPRGVGSEDWDAETVCRV